MTPPVVVSIAATDSSGGAGLTADLCTFAALGVHGAGVVTAVTAQDTTAVHAVHPVPLDIVMAQLDAVLTDLRPSVVKVGMIGSAEAVVCLSQRLADVSGTRVQIVVDPVLRASTGASFTDDTVVAAYREHLLPVATVITPNEEELRVLGCEDHAGLVVTRGGDVVTTNDHGTGCTYASALAAYLALGRSHAAAITAAHGFVARQLEIGRTWDIGRGRGPVAHTTKEIA